MSLAKTGIKRRRHPRTCWKKVPDNAGTQFKRAKAYLCRIGVTWPAMQSWHSRASGIKNVFDCPGSGRFRDLQVRLVQGKEVQCQVCNNLLQAMGFSKPALEAAMNGVPRPRKKLSLRAAKIRELTKELTSELTREMSVLLLLLIFRTSLPTSTPLAVCFWSFHKDRSGRSFRSSAVCIDQGAGRQAKREILLLPKSRWQSTS